MKRQLWQAVVLLTVILEAATVLGQANRGDLIANIPFSFVVANHTLPAGRYIVTPFGENNLRIYNSASQGALVLTHSVQGSAPESSGKLVFHRYGQVYFLSEAWVAANAIGRQVFPSSAEEELAAKGTEKEIAVLRIVR